MSLVGIRAAAAQARLRQRVFRDQMLEAYDAQCAVCRLPSRELLEATYILPDRERRRSPEVPNGISMCVLHGGAFKRDLLGIRPDGVIEMSPRLLEFNDGPTLEHALKGFHQRRLVRPRASADAPRPEYLEKRYELFRLGA